MLYPAKPRARAAAQLEFLAGDRPMQAVRVSKARRFLFVLVLLPIVQWQGATDAVLASAGKEQPAAESATRPPETPAAERKPLPPSVREMRQTILEAVRTGRIEDLRIAIEWNELPPDFGAPKDVAPIDFLKKESDDGQGREILAILGKLLDLAPEQAPLGADLENNAIYVWPYLAARRLDKLEPHEEVDLYRLMPFEEAKAMREKKKWTWWTVIIGADGTWHSFKKAE